MTLQGSVAPAFSPWAVTGWLSLCIERPAEPCPAGKVQGCSIVTNPRTDTVCWQRVRSMMKEDYLGTLKSLLERARPRLAKSYRLEFKNCFGAVAGYVNGNIFMSCGRFGVALRLPPRVLEDLFDERGVSHLKYFPNVHVKQEYSLIPQHILHNQVRLQAL